MREKGPLSISSYFFRREGSVKFFNVRLAFFCNLEKRSEQRQVGEKLSRVKWARVKLLKVLKNSYVRIAVLYIIILLALWFGPRVAFRTNYPLLAVASGSMIPTLQVGDLIMVQGVPDANEIYAAPKPDGAMIVFYRPSAPRGGPFLFYTGEELIVHRAIAKVENGGMWYFQTQGDNPRTNPGPDYWGGSYPDAWNGMVSERLLVGKVVGVVPWVGNLPLFMRTPQGLALIVFLFILILLIEFIPVLLGKQEQDQKSPTSQSLSVWRSR